MKLEIVTPEARVYEEEVDSVVLPTTTGEVGILPGHIPLMTELEPGQLQAARSGQTELLAVSKGFAQVVGDKISVLAEGAIDIEQIDPEEIEAAQLRAQEELEKLGDADPEEVERLETTIQFYSLQRLLKKRR